MKATYISKHTLLLWSVCLTLSLGACGKQEDPLSLSHTEFTDRTYDLSLEPLPIEKIGDVKTLPKRFPKTWMFVDEVSFFNMFGGKMILLDVAESHPPSRIKGIADKNLIGNFAQSKQRPEFYIAETFHTRGARGPRIDVLTIYDKTTLSPIKEIVLPLERLTALPERYAMALSNDDRFLYVANFTPASSFSVIDLDSRELVSTNETPGCVLLYPTGNRNVTSICSNGGLLTTTIDRAGRMVSQERLPPFFDTDKTPVFERPAIINNMAYFPSFDGHVHVVDLRGNIARYVERWDMLSVKDRSAGWRPGGLALTDQDHRGRMYIIMHKDGYDGSHNHGGTHVWVFDAQDKKRVKIIETPSWAISIAVSRGKDPLLVVTNGELNLDVFDADSGKLVHTISDFGNVTPLLVHKTY